MITWRWRGIRELNASLDRKARASDRTLRKAVSTAAGLVAEAARVKIFVPERITIQDTTRPRRITRRPPIRKHISDRKAVIELAAYWARARAKPVEEVMQRHGYGERLFRRELWVVPGGKRRNPRGNVVKRRFREWPRLERWARDEDKQYQRHAVRIPGPVVLDLVLGPAVAQQRTRVRNLMRAALAEALATR